ncbi:hypothetical protein BDQ17DRAFT_1309868 [Cyathus striatus]|nr:hypothetical protein BDQ17DRAFT_1309868 [Cyathus striatus]
MGIVNIETIVRVYENSPVINFLDVSSIALVIFDYFLLLDLEVEHMWNSKQWTITKAAFFYLRYMPFLESVVLIYWTTPFNLMTVIPSIHLCSQAYKTSMALALPGIMIGEMTLSIRTWAVWKRDRRVGIGLVLFSLATAIPGIIGMILFIKTSIFGLDTNALGVTSCGFDGGSRIISVVWIALMVYDASLLALMVISARVWNKPYLKIIFNGGPESEPERLLEPILREGIIYYFYLFVLSALNVVVIFIMPPDFMNMMAMMERMIHSVLTCRIILHIREGPGRSDYESSSLPTTPLNAVKFKADTGHRLRSSVIVGPNRMAIVEKVDM